MAQANLHIAICGHAKHGKSTLAGRLAFEMNAISLKQLQVYEVEAKERGKDFNKFSMIFLKKRSATFTKGSGLPDDSSRSVFPTRSAVELNDTKLILIDTPGFSRFLNNIIYGIYLSDKAIMVVESKAGVTIGTETLCRILKSFRVSILAFCVTKMDTIDYSESRFEEVKADIKKLIKRYDLNQEIPIIPISALKGEGISINQNSNFCWNKNKSLIEIIKESKETSLHKKSMDIRFGVEGKQEVLSPTGVGTVIIGTLESGNLKVGQTLVVEPTSTIQNQMVSTQIKSIHLARGVTDDKFKPVIEASPRSILAVKVSDWSKSEAESYLYKGGIFGPPQNRPTVSKNIIADLIFFESDIVYYGKEYKLHPHVFWTMVRIKKIINKEKLCLNLSNDEYLSEEGELVTAHIEFKAPCCIETVSEHPRLSRFVLREMNRVIACGKCVRIID